MYGFKYPLVDLGVLVIGPDSKVHVRIGGVAQLAFFLHVPPGAVIVTAKFFGNFEGWNIAALVFFTYVLFLAPALYWGVTACREINASGPSDEELRKRGFEVK